MSVLTQVLKIVGPPPTLFSRPIAPTHRCETCGGKGWVIEGYDTIDCPDCTATATPAAAPAPI